MKQFKFVLMMIMSIALVMLIGSCKKSSDSNPINPNGVVDYGGGTFSFNTNSSIAGNYSMSGSFNPATYGSTGTGVMCWYDSSSNTAYVYGFKWRSSNDWDLAVLAFSRAKGTAIGTGSYSFSDGSAILVIIKGATSSTLETGTGGDQYALTSGTANVTSYSSTGMKGNFSGAGVQASGGAVGTEIQVTNGSFDVTFGTEYGI